MSTHLLASIESMVAAEAAGEATPAELEALSSDPGAWAATLRSLLVDTEAGLAGARRLSGSLREQAVADLEEEWDSLATALRRLTGEGPAGAGSGAPSPGALRQGGGAGGPGSGRGGPGSGSGDGAGSGRGGPASGSGDGSGRRRPAPGPGALVPPLGSAPPRLQGSWAGGRVVLWAGGPGAHPGGLADLEALVEGAGAASLPWAPHAGVGLPGGGRAAGVSTPVGDALGWLVGVGAGQVGLDVAPSVAWLGRLAVWATELVAGGRVAPSLRRTQHQPGQGRAGGAGSAGRPVAAGRSVGSGRA
ncbi:MAG: hypothetical protein ACRDZQ_01810, partial [Acidimicrobiales bacterium]